MNIRRTSSGQHEAVKAHRAKMESIQDGVLEELKKLNQELDSELEASKTTDVDTSDLEKP